MFLGCHDCDSQIKCMKCLGKTEQFERMMDLTVEIGGEIGTLEEALAQFTATETLDGDNRFHCNRLVHFLLYLVVTHIFFRAGLTFSFSIHLIFLYSADFCIGVNLMRKPERN